MRNSDLIIHVEGSSGTLYKVSLARRGDSLETTCTCQAGAMRKHCKHRLNLFAGDVTQVRGCSEPDLAAKISVMLSGTDVEAAYRALGAAELEAKISADKLKKAKKALDRVMHK